MDVRYATTPSIIHNHMYVLVVIDAYSKWIELLFATLRSDLEDKLMALALRTKTKNNLISLKKVKWDRAGEFENDTVRQFFISNGCAISTVGTKASNINGLAEQTIETLTEMANAMRFDGGADKSFWALSWAAPCHILNTISSSRPSDVESPSPYQIRHRVKPNIDHFRRMFCKVHYHIRTNTSDKDEPRTRQGFFVGYSYGSPEGTIMIYHSALSSGDNTSTPCITEISSKPTPFILNKTDTINHYIWHHTTDETMVIGNISQRSLRLFLDSETSTRITLDNYAGPVSYPDNPLVTSQRPPVDILRVPRVIRKQPLQDISIPIPVASTHIEDDNSKSNIGIASTLPQQRYNTRSSSRCLNNQTIQFQLYDPDSPICSYTPVFSESSPTQSLTTTQQHTALSSFHVDPPTQIIQDAQSSRLHQSYYIHLERDTMISAWLTTLNIADGKPPIAYPGEVESGEVESGVAPHPTCNTLSSISFIQDIAAVSHPDNAIAATYLQPTGQVMATQLLDYNNPEGILEWTEQPLNDHITYNYSILAMQSIGDTPKNFGSATRAPFNTLWIDAIKDELSGHLQRPTFELALRPDRHNTDDPNRYRTVHKRWRWVFICKYKDGVIIKRKARLKIDGSTLVAGTDFEERNRSSPVVSMHTSRMCLSLAARYNLVGHQLDVVQAFLSSPLNEGEKVLIEKPPGLDMLPEYQYTKDKSYPSTHNDMIICNVLSAIYGLPTAGNAFWRKISAVLLDMQYIQVPDAPALFVRVSPDGSTCLIPTYVDDFRVYTNKPEDFKDLMSTLKAYGIICTDTTASNQYLGLELTSVDGCYLLSAEQMITRMCVAAGIGSGLNTISDGTGLLWKQSTDKLYYSSEAGKYKDNARTKPRNQMCWTQDQYANRVCSLTFIVSCTRPEITPWLSLLAAHLCEPFPVHYDLLLSVMRFLLRTRKFKLGFTGGRKHVSEIRDPSGDDRTHHLLDVWKGHEFFETTTILKGQSIPLPSTNHTSTEELLTTIRTERLIAFCDSSHHNHVTKQYTQMGYLIYLNGDLITWKSLTAKTALNSTQSGELLVTFHAYRAIASASKILQSASFKHDGRLIIHTDSKAVQNGLTNEKYEPTSAKYLTTKLVQLYQEMHDNMSIAVNLILSQDNLSDITTKEVSLKILNLFLCQTYCDMAAEVEDIPIEATHLSQPPAPLVKRKPQSSRSLQESRKQRALLPDNPCVSYDGTEDTTRFPSSKVSTD